VGLTIDAQNHSHCLSYEPSVVQLKGTIVRKIFPGPPNYESIKRGDKAEETWLLVLSQPTCVQQDKKDLDLNPAQQNIRQLQLVFGDSKAHEIYKELVAKKLLRAAPYSELIQATIELRFC